MVKIQEANVIFVLNSVIYVRNSVIYVQNTRFYCAKIFFYCLNDCLSFRVNMFRRSSICRSNQIQTDGEAVKRQAPAIDKKAMSERILSHPAYIFEN
jgi:hypothetical protein